MKTDFIDAYTDTIEFARAKHAGQKRKYTDEDYIVHPINVGRTLWDIGAPRCVVEAGILHDTVEDTETTEEELFAKFGDDTVQLTLAMTEGYEIENYMQNNRKTRKAMEVERWRKEVYWAQTIKLADLIDNTRTIVQYDPNFARVYLKEKEALLQVLTGHRVLLQYAQDILVLSKRILRI